MLRLHFILLLILTLLACGKPPPPRPIDRLYQSLQESREDFDPTVLQGRTILIDPGHGGRYTGTTGKGGLMEKDVNLGVALYLWGLLHDAGANAFLTRSVDKDFLAEEPEGTLTQDLAARVAIADSTEPDLFLSIHHNARADTNHNWNRIETYYPMGDNGPSLDASRAIHYHLMRNLGIEEGHLLPGNFFVLRQNDVPSVLGEPSYLSHPPVEKKLVMGEKRRLEAEAYFLGIVTYFSRGVPEARVEEPPDTVRQIDELFLLGFVEDEKGHQGIDPSSVQAYLDGDPLPLHFDPTTGAARAALPRELSPGEHTVTLAARNLEGNATRRLGKTFSVDLLPAKATVEAVWHPDKKGATLYVRLRDERGIPVADGTRVQVPAWKTNQETVEGSFGIRIVGDTLPNQVSLQGDRFSLESTIRPEDIFSPACILRVQTRQNEPVAGAEVWRNGVWAGATRPGGWIALDRPATGEDRFRIEKEGFQTLLATPVGNDSSIHELQLDERSGLPVEGKCVLIDPEGADGPGLFPRSERSLLFARYLSEMIRWAGGVAELTRTGSAVPPVTQRIALAGRCRADYWITVGFGDSLSVTHFPDSREGTPAARSIAATLSRRFRRPVPVGQSAEPVLRDTPCPALRITLPFAPGGGRSPRAHLRVAAQAVAEGLAERLEGDSNGATVWVDSLRPGALVTVDDAVTFQAWGKGSLRIRFVPPGLHKFQLETPDGWKEHWIEIAAGEEVRVR